MWSLVVPVLFVEKSIFSPSNSTCSFVRDQLTTFVWVYLSSLYSVHCAELRWRPGLVSMSIIVYLHWYLYPLFLYQIWLRRERERSAYRELWDRPGREKESTWSKVCSMIDKKGDLLLVMIKEPPSGPTLPQITAIKTLDKIQKNNTWRNLEVIKNKKILKEKYGTG